MSWKPGAGLAVLCAFLILNGCRPAPGWYWERAEVGLPRQTVVLALAADPADPDRLWAGYYAPDGLAASRDGGQTWTNGGQGLGDSPVFDLLPLPDGSLWAATRDGLRVSSDGGASWEPATGELPAATVFALAANRSGHIVAGLDGAGLYVSEAGDDAWRSLSTPAGEATPRAEALASAAVLSLAVSPDGAQLYAGTGGQGVFASRDGGRDWIAAFAGDYAPNLALNPARPASAVASLRDRLARTQDGGASWEVLPVAWSRQEVVSLLWLAGPSATGGHGTLWAGAGDGRVYCSQDGADSWTETAALPAQGGVLALAAAGDRLLAGAWTGVYARPGPERCAAEDAGWTYLSPSVGVPYANALLAADAGLLIGTRSGLFRWEPAERRWTRAPLPHSQGSQGVDFPPGGVTTLAVAPSDPQVLYAGTAASGVYRSADGGATWTKVASDLEIGVRALAVAPDDADHVYIVAAWERVYESGDGGQSWQARWTGLDVATEAICLALDPWDPAVVYLGVEGGLYRSAYTGQDWRPVGRLLDGQTVLTVQARRVGEASVLYLGATRGVYRSADGGETLEPWGRGLEDTSVTAFLFDRENPDIVYAGTAYAGLYRSADGGATWQSIGPPELSAEVVESMAWGPASELFLVSAGGVWIGID